MASYSSPNMAPSDLLDDPKIEHPPPGQEPVKQAEARARSRSPPRVEEPAPVKEPVAAKDGVSRSLELSLELESFIKDIDADKSTHKRIAIRGSGGCFGDRNDLNDISILGKVAVDRKAEFVEKARNDNLFNRAMGSMCGMAVGDALGHPFEFLPAQDAPSAGSPHFNLKEMKFLREGNKFRLQRGQWTDDASMGLCMADSLILRRGFDGPDMRIRFWCWWNRGYNNAFRKDSTRSGSVGLGGNISKSLSAISGAKSPADVPPTFNAKSEDAGNGSLMRYTPIALFLHEADVEEIWEVSRMSSYTTHPGIIAAEACAFLGHLIVRALQLPADSTQSAKDFLETTTKEYYTMSGLSKKSGWGYDQMTWLVLGKPTHDTEKCWSWRDPQIQVRATLKARGNSYNGYPVSAGYFGSYSLDGLALALWCIYNSTSFDEAVTKSVNLLGDADSHGSITGQLAGAFYGYNAIHPQFLKWLNKWDDHDFAVRGALLCHLGSQVGKPAL